MACSLLLLRRGVSDKFMEMLHRRVHCSSHLLSIPGVAPGLSSTLPPVPPVAAFTRSAHRCEGTRAESPAQRTAETVRDQSEQQSGSTKFVAAPTRAAHLPQFRERGACSWSAQAKVAAQTSASQARGMPGHERPEERAGRGLLYTWL